MPEVEITIPRFDPSAVKPGKVWLFLGKRASGKSYALEYMMYWWRYVDDAVVFSTTETANGTWSAHFPPIFVHDNFYPDRLDRLCKRNKAWYSHRKKHPELPKISTLVILEDCMAGRGKNAAATNPNIEDIVLNGRHYGFTLVIISQYVMKLPPVLRSNVDYVVLLENDMGTDIKKIYDNWFTKLGNLKTFQHLFTELTKEHGMMILDRTINDHGNFLNKIFRLRAPPPDKLRPYQLCHKLAWRFQQKRSRDEDDEGEQYGAPDWLYAHKKQKTSGRAIDLTRKDVDIVIK